jgi:hypothetical protein
MDKGMGRRLRISIALLLLTPVLLPALSYVAVQTGEIIVFKTETEGAPSPIITTVGAALPVVEVGVFRLEISALLWGTQYYIAPQAGRPVPAEYQAGQFSVLGVWVAPLAGVVLPLAAGKVEMGAAGGVAANVRLPLFPYDRPAEGDTAAQEAWAADRRTAATYFLGKARFLFPEVDLWARWYINQRLSLSLAVKTLFPIFHAWDGDGLGLGDQLHVAAVLGFGIRIPPRQHHEPRADAAAETPQGAP